MDTRKAFGQVLRMARKRRGVSQEGLGNVSGRTYVSALERGLQSPTLQKIEELAAELGIHGLTLVAAAFARRDGESTELLLSRLKRELDDLQN